MKLNWFSPLAPARSEIALYTACTVAALRGHAEVTFWTDQAEWDSRLEQIAPVRRFDVERLSWSDLHRADLSIYQIGNHPAHHRGIWEISRQLPGIVVLHDLRLHDLFFCLFQEQRRRDRYLGYLEKYHGEAGQVAGERFLSGDLSKDHMAENYPLTALAVEEAAGVVVHTPEAFDCIKALEPCPVTQLCLPYAATRHVGAPGSRKSVTQGSGPYRLIVFGHLSRNRRLDALFQALAAFQERDRFHLDIYGSVPDIEYLDTQIAALDLQPLVTVHGFVSEEELDRALQTADLAVNLRYPSMGEASASQLRIWDHSLPSLVTAVGWYATLPGSVVSWVRPEHEIVDIQAHLQAFLTDPGLYVRQGADGRRLLEEQHAPENYARALVDFASAARRFRLRRLASGLVARVGAQLSTWSDLRAPWDLYRNTAEQIRRIAS
jgi:glycosyltransferase involved in cell wall biosynthesis